MKELDLEALRKRIDYIDREIASLIQERLEICRELGELKRSLGLPVRDPEREKEVVSRVPPRLHRIFKIIIEECVSIQESS